MIRFILTKIKNKYKLYLCLMIGNISVIMIFAMIMMFRGGSERKLIQTGFVREYEETGTFPAVISRKDGITGQDITGTDIEASIDAYSGSWEKYLELPVVAEERLIRYKEIKTDFSYRGDGYIDIGYFSGSVDPAAEDLGIFSFADRIDEEAPEGAIPCYVSTYTAERLDIVPGELLYFSGINGNDNKSENPPALFVKGIVREKEGSYFWHKSLAECEFLAIVSKEGFEGIVNKYPRNTYYEIFESFDYRYIDTVNAEKTESVLSQFAEKDEFITENITPVLKKYKEERKSIRLMLYVIVLPLVVLIVLFTGMIAFRIIDSERGELSTMRGRGLGIIRIMGLYLLQAVILAGICIPVGIAAGYGFGLLMARATSFMSFGWGSSAPGVSDYSLDIMMIPAAFIGALLDIIIMLVPVALFFRKKKEKRASGLPVWEKYFIDVILLIVSLYLLFNYNRQRDILRESVINGEGIDPFVFINATLFLFACGMLMLRLIMYLARLYYKAGKNKFSPAAYSGILQVLRTAKSSSVISVFMVMTIAMSLFNANIARTINTNKDKRLKYECGTDVRINEEWKLYTRKGNEETTWKYGEPDFEIYKKLYNEGIFTSVTKVVNTDRAVARISGREALDIKLMGIHTREFGETAMLESNGATVNGEIAASGTGEGQSAGGRKHWFEYLNKLADEPDGIIISENMAKEAKLKVGDNVTIGMKSPGGAGKVEVYASVTLKVVGVVDVWPGYSAFAYERDEDGKIIEEDNYLVIMNYAGLVSTFGITPYEVWAKTEKNTEEITAALEESFAGTDRRVESVRNWRDEIKKEKSSAIVQITNGLFSADFLVALMLAIIGYLIYWITSIRDRELLFGIYRAMGISKKEINVQLLIEQMLLTVTSIAAGVIAGEVASKLFTNLFAAVYMPEKHSLDLVVVSYGADLIRLGAVLAAVVVICIMQLRRIVGRLNITEALKLGDD